MAEADTHTAKDITTDVQNVEPTSSATKKKRKKKTAKKHILTSFTIRDPQWAYVKLQRLSSATNVPPLDAVTTHMYLTSALYQVFGLHGAAIAFDVMKLEGQDVWIRLPAEDRTALIAAVGGWVSNNGEGWRVKGWSSWDAGVSNFENGQDLFD